jgi:hypothetical protein
VDKTMRIDYFHIGDAKKEMATIDQVYEQGSWAGNLNNLIDTFNNGRYSVKVYDLSSGILIFSKGFDSCFGEYKTTDEAIKGVKRTCHETVRVPYPKNKIRFVLEVRDRKNELVPFFSQAIDPASIDVRSVHPALIHLQGKNFSTGLIRPVIFSSHFLSISEKASYFRLSTSSTAQGWLFSANRGIAISEFDRLSQAIWPENL